MADNSGKAAGGSGTDWGSISQALSGLVPFLGPILGLLGSNGGDVAKNPMQGEMNALLRHQLGRLRAQDPLYSDVLGMARGMLPTRYRGAGPAMPGSGGPGDLGAKPGDPGTDTRQPGPQAQPTGRIPTWRL